MVFDWLRKKGAEILGEPAAPTLQPADKPKQNADGITFYHRFNGLVRPVPPPSKEMTEWDLFSPMLYLAQKSAITLDRIREGIFISGITGGGKTSGPLYTLGRLFFDWQFGALILTVKPELDREFWERVAKEAGREDDLIVIGPDEPHYFNFFEYELNRPRGSEPRNIINLLVQLSEGRRKGGERTNDKFWKEQFDLILEKTITLLQMAREPVTLDNIFDVINSAPKREDLATDKAKEAWQKESLNWYCLQTADSNVDLATQQYEAGEDPVISISLIDDYPTVVDFWLKQAIKYDDRTEGNILAELVGTLNPFRSGRVRDVLNSKRHKTTVTPEDVLDGKILLIDFPVEEWYAVGETIQFVFNLMVQRAILRRRPSNSNRPIALIGDEFHAHFNAYDHKTQATIRDRNGVRLVACQNLPMFYSELGTAHKSLVDAFLGNLALKIFGKNTCKVTNEWSSGTFDKEYVYVNSSSTSSGENNRSHSTSRREEQRSIVPSIAFQRLKDGGPKNKNIVETLIHNKGDFFEETQQSFIVASWIQSYTFQLGDKQP